MPRTARGIVFTGPREVALEDFVLPDPGPSRPSCASPAPWSAPGRRSPASWGPRLPEPTALEPSASPTAGQCVPGYSSVGVVEAVGRGVSGWPG